MLRKTARLSPALMLLLVLSACTTMPTGPSVLVLPGSGKSFDQFRADDAECRQFAYEQMGGTTAAAAANDSGARSAVAGTLLGAVAGAAIGGSHGAAVGAGSGLLVGGLAGAGAADASAYATQRRYDFSYQQCMYAQGHRVPMSGRFATQRPRTGYPPPPPPPGTPPPPPPR